MKKLLLSAAALMGFASFAMAESVTENFADAATQAWFGVTAKANCTGDVLTCTSAETGISYSYTFSYASKGNGVISQGTDATPEGSANAYLAATLKFATRQLVLKTGASASKAAVVNVYAGETLIKENLALNEQGTDFTVAIPEANSAAGTIIKIENVSAKNAQLATITYNSEAGAAVDPDPVTPTPDVVTFTKTAAIESGAQYVLAIGSQVGTVIASNLTYGRLSLAAAAFADEEVSTVEANAITIAEDNGAFTLLDSYGRYLSMDAEHFTSFQLYTEPQAGSYWDAEFVDGALKLTNALNTDCIVCKSGTYTNIAPIKAADAVDPVYPALYKKNTAGVAAVEAEGAAEYYTLQGVRVANPDKGIYIAVRGGKASKVVLK